MGRSNSHRANKMCGIAGIFVPQDSVVPEYRLSEMLKVMRHRGPDGSQFHISQNRHFQAAFTRLAIIDVENAQQPLIEEGGKWVFLGNGEIYNYVQIKSSLEREGVKFTTKGDMEPAFKLFIKEGNKFINKLNGMFALAAYSRDEHRLLLARDHFGIKPLYWAKTSNGIIVFASEIKSLFNSGLIRPKLNKEVLYSYLSHGFIPSPHTLFLGVYKIPPASMMSINSSGDIHFETYWEPHAALDFPKDKNEIKEELLLRLKASIKSQLNSDVPLAVLLSGGIDSGLIVALSSEFLSKPLKTYTVNFSYAKHNETPLACEVAERYHTEHHVIEVNGEHLAETLPKLVWYCEEPLFDASFYPNYLISKELAQNVKVVLNGTGGDELFAGYGRYFPTPMERMYNKVPSWLRTHLIESGIAPFNPLLAWKLSRAGKFQTDRYAYLHEHLTQFPLPILNQMGVSQQLFVPAQSTLMQNYGGPIDSGQLIADMKTYLCEDLLLLLDRTTMANSVEGRVPFLDKSLAEAALAVPPAIRTPNQQQKGLLREIASSYLPQSVIRAPKQGFASPMENWMSGDFGNLVANLLQSRNALSRDLWTKESIDYLLLNKRKNAFKLYSIAILELTIQIHIEGKYLEAPNGGVKDFSTLVKKHEKTSYEMHV